MFKSSQSGQAVVKAFSSSSNPWKQLSRGRIVSFGVCSSRKPANLSLRMWQMAYTSSFPIAMPNTGASCFKNSINSPSSLRVRSSSCCSFSVSNPLCRVSNSSSFSPPASKGGLSQSETSLKPSLLSKGEVIVSSRYLMVAFLSICAFYSWMACSKLQSKECWKHDSVSKTADCGPFFCLMYIVVFWLRHFRL